VHTHIHLSRATATPTCAFWILGALLVLLVKQTHLTRYTILLFPPSTLHSPYLARNFFFLLASNAPKSPPSSLSIFLVHCIKYRSAHIAAIPPPLVHHGYLHHEYFMTSTPHPRHIHFPWVLWVLRSSQFSLLPDVSYLYLTPPLDPRDVMRILLRLATGDYPPSVFPPHRQLTLHTTVPRAFSTAQNALILLRMKSFHTHTFLLRSCYV
jgi:hypothetical protein